MRMTANMAMCLIYIFIILISSTALFLPLSLYTPSELRPNGRYAPERARAAQ